MILKPRRVHLKKWRVWTEWRQNPKPAKPSKKHEQRHGLAQWNGQPWGQPNGQSRWQMKVLKNRWLWSECVRCIQECKKANDWGWYLDLYFQIKKFHMFFWNDEHDYHTQPFYSICMKTFKPVNFFENHIRLCQKNEFCLMNFPQRQKLWTKSLFSKKYRFFDA